MAFDPVTFGAVKKVVPVGTVVEAITSPGPDYLKLDGGWHNRADYPALADMWNRSLGTLDVQETEHFSVDSGEPVDVYVSPTGKISVVCFGVNGSNYPGTLFYQETVGGPFKSIPATEPMSGTNYSSHPGQFFKINGAVISVFYHGFFLSLDDGETWQRVLTPFPLLNTNTATYTNLFKGGVVSRNPTTGRIYAATKKNNSNGALFYTDDLVNWTEITNIPTYSSYTRSPHIASFVYYNASAGRLCVISALYSSPTHYLHGCYSTDEGATWVNGTAVFSSFDTNGANSGFHLPNTNIFMVCQQSAQIVCQDVSSYTNLGSPTSAGYCSYVSLLRYDTEGYWATNWNGNAAWYGSGGSVTQTVTFNGNITGTKRQVDLFSYTTLLASAPIDENSFSAAYFMTQNGSGTATGTYTTPVLIQYQSVFGARYRGGKVWGGGNGFVHNMTDNIVYVFGRYSSKISYNPTDAKYYAWNGMRLFESNDAVSWTPHSQSKDGQDPNRYNKTYPAMTPFVVTNNWLIRLQSGYPYGYDIVGSVTPTSFAGSYTPCHTVKKLGSPCNYGGVDYDTVVLGTNSYGTGYVTILRTNQTANLAAINTPISHLGIRGPVLDADFSAPLNLWLLCYPDCTVVQTANLNAASYTATIAALKSISWDAANSRFVGTDGTSVVTSTDGFNFVQHPYDDQGITDVCSIVGVAFGSAGQVVAYGPNTLIVGDTLNSLKRVALTGDWNFTYAYQRGADMIVADEWAGKSVKVIDAVPNDGTQFQVPVRTHAVTGIDYYVKAR